MPDADAPVYIISVAAELTGLHPQTLRSYDRLGLVSPGRAGGGARRYSMRDIQDLQRIAQLTAEGIGLEGVRRILALEARVAALEAQLAAFESGSPALAGSPVGTLPRSPAESNPFALVPLRRPSTAVVLWRRGRR